LLSTVIIVAFLMQLSVGLYYSYELPEVATKNVKHKSPPY